MMMMCALDQTTEFDFYSVSSLSQQEDMSFYSDTLSWMSANQSLLLHLHDVCLVEKQQIPIL